MKTYVVLLRGANVGGKNILPMKELKVHLESNGFENVKTYIQSGNLILQSSYNPEQTVKTLIQSHFGFTPEVLALSEDEFNSSAINNPYQEYDGKFVHSYYCKEVPKIDFSKLTKFISATEQYEVLGNVFYLHAPDGIGRSKLVANIEACLGVPATGRNLNTVTKLKAMISQ